MQDMYKNLPGVMADFKDGGLRVKSDPSPPATESVLLLGTAIDGPLLEPVAVDQGTVELVFGKATRANGLPNGTTLVKGFEQAYDGGSRDVRLMRVTGAYAIGQITAESTTRALDNPVDIVIGPAPGNKGGTLQLNQANVILASVVVNANGQNLPSSAYTVTPGSTSATPSTPVFGSVVLKDSVADSNASIYVTYQYTDGQGNIVSTQQNGFVDGTGALHRYYAGGENVTLVLPSTVKPGTLNLYAGGVAVEPAGYTIGIDVKSITLKPGYVTFNSTLEATYIHNETITESPVLQLRSYFAGALYNNVQYEVKDIVNQASDVVGKQVVLTKPEAKKSQIAEAPRVYSSLDFPSFQLLVNAINADLNNNVIRASVPNRFADADTSKLVSSGSSFLSNGDDGLSPSPQTMFEALGGVRDGNGLLTRAGAYQLLENYTVDHVTPLGVYADTKLGGKYDNFAHQLAMACAVMTFRNHSTLGYVAVSPPDEVTLQTISDQVGKLRTVKNDYYMRDRVGNVLKDNDGNSIDLGRFVSVLAGPDNVFNSPRLGVYAEVSPAAYAGFVAQLAPQSAPTNKVTAYSQGLRYQFSNAQLDELTGLRFVTFKTKNNGASVAVTDGMTAAQPGSDYVRLNTIRVVKEAVDQIRIAADPFIGEPNETAQQNALSSAIGKRLDGLKAAGVIVAYEFTIIASPQDRLLGQAKIELTLVPPQELRQLTTVVSLKPSL